MKNQRSRRAQLVIATALLLGAAACSDSSSEEAIKAETGATTDDWQAAPPVTPATPLSDGPTAVSDTGIPLALAFEGLPALNGAGAYEVWSIVDDVPITGGLFDIDDNGQLTDPANGGPANVWAEAGLSDIVITLEPYPDTDPEPADTHVLAGSVNDDGSLTLTIDHPAVFGHDFSEASGTVLLATPTNGPDSDELSGIWFLKADDKSPTLDLPTLPPGWRYEGWAVQDGTPLSTGTFTDPTVADDAAPFSGPEPGPDRPGEDFLVNAPDGVSFPTDLSGAKAVITVEPYPDNSPEPFTLKPLIGDFPDDAESGVDYPLDQSDQPMLGAGWVG